MASVRMTNELRMDIRRNAERAYELANPEPAPSTEYIDRVRRAVVNSPIQKFLKDMAEIGEERGLTRTKVQSVLPRPNKEAVTGVQLRRMNTDMQNNRDYDSHTIRFSTQMHKYYVTEESYSRWGDPTVYIEDFSDDDRLEVGDLFTKLQTDHDAWHEARRAYENSIGRLLENVTTLKQLLEVWPAAESLVPAEKIQKLHTKENRKQQAKRVKEEISFDPTIANQAVLTAKMLGG
jgi:hypothetical protein